MDRGRLRRHRGAQHLHLGDPAQYAQLRDPGLLRYRAHAARHSDLLGHRRHQLSRRPHHRRSDLGQCRPEIPALDRRLRGAADRDPHLPADFLPGSDARSQDQDRGVAGMSTDAVAVLGFIALFTLMLLRVPVGMAMGLVGVSGFGYLVGFSPALKLVGQTSMRTVTDYTFGVIPMFLLMGTLVSNSGMTRELFRSPTAFVGHLRDGLGLATVAPCG